MAYDKAFIAAKLHKWEGVLTDLALPKYDQLPALDLYMDQVVSLVSGYLSFMQQADAEKLITPSTINNYVRMKVMPPPVKKRYTRVHIAYLVIICSLKQTLSIANIQRLLPLALTEDEVRDIYNEYIDIYRLSCVSFIDQVQAYAAHVLDPAYTQEKQVVDLVYTSAVTASLAKLLTEKLLAYRDESDLSKV